MQLLHDIAVENVVWLEKDKQTNQTMNERPINKKE